MMKIIKILAVVILGLVVVLGVVWLGAHLFTSNSQWARAIAWLDSDIDDYKRLPMRVVSNAPPAFNFQQPSAEISKRYAPAFESITYSKGGKNITENFGKFLKQTSTVAFIVIKDDVLLYEQYFGDYDHNSTVTSFSTAKSFVSALVGIAISEGYISSVEDSITKYVPELLDKDPRYTNITLRNLLTMSSGIHYEERGLPWSDDAATYFSPNLRSVAISSRLLDNRAGSFITIITTHC